MQKCKFVKKIGLFAIIFLFHFSLSSFYEFNFLFEIANQLQNQCKNSIPEELKSKNLSSAFLCGTNIVDSEQQFAFKNTGLIHLIVVSGSHLKLLSLFLVKIFSEIIKSSLLLNLILLPTMIFYCFLTGFQAPALRAFFQYLLGLVSERLKLNWNLNQRTLLSGVFLLVLFPGWIYSFSFYLSWLTSLGFCFPFPQTEFNKWSSLLKHLFISSFVQLLVSSALKSFSVISLFCNIAIAPVLSVILWPMSLAPLITEKLNSLSDFAWLKIIYFLKSITPSTLATPQVDFNNFDWFSHWLLIAFVHSAFHWFSLAKSRRET